jgi:hypothetical protein
LFATPATKSSLPEGADEILGGYAHFRSDMLLYNREGRDHEEIKQLLAWLDGHNTVSRGLLLPGGLKLGLWRTVICERLSGGCIHMGAEDINTGSSEGGLSKCQSRFVGRQSI